MPLTSKDWHQRFTRQASWTRDLRHFFYRTIRIQDANSILDVGCGTGALETELKELTPAEIHGFDINYAYLKICNENNTSVTLVQGDAHSLPYQPGSFDVCLSHYLFMWLKYPAIALAEMCRVTRPGGFVLALAEPDYGGRIDYPPQLAQIGKWQQIALNSQGAEPNMGRKLASIFAHAGLNQIKTGVIGGQWTDSITEEELASEWLVIQSDLEQTDAPLHDQETLTNLKRIDASAWQTGERVLYVPTFYAIGIIPVD